MNYLDIEKSRHFSVPLFSEEEAIEKGLTEKKWSFSNVYHLVELVNVFIAIKHISYDTLKDFTKRAVASDLPFVKTSWTSRRVLEHLNALVNFGILSKSYSILNDVFSEEKYIKIITPEHKEVFMNIYHNYFRFKELHSWMMSPIQNDHYKAIKGVCMEDLIRYSNPIFSFCNSGRFNDSFICNLIDNPDIFQISDEKDSGTTGATRFWDVYVKWGQELGVIDKFNLNVFNYELLNSSKSISCVYYINTNKVNINIENFIKSEFDKNNIYIPELVYKIIIKYRYRIEDIKQTIIEQTSLDFSRFSLQRTSEAFINSGEKRFFPKFQNSFISNILLR